VAVLNNNHNQRNCTVLSNEHEKYKLTETLDVQYKMFDN